MVGIWIPAHVAVMVPPGTISVGVTLTRVAATAPGPPAVIFATNASPHGPPK